MDINIDFDDVFEDLRKELTSKSDYLQDVREGKIQFDNTNPLAIANIMDAAKSGNFEVLQELKNMGADFDVQDDKGNTALMNAIISRQMFENPKSVVFLLQNTKDFNILNNDGENVAMVALNNHCQDKLVQSFIERTDNVYTESRFNRNILTSALSHDDLSMDTIGLLLAKATGKDKDEVTKNIKANYSGNTIADEETYKAQLLILAGASPIRYFGRNTSAIIQAQFNIMQSQAQRIKEQQQEILKLKPEKEKQGSKAVDFNAVLLNKSMRTNQL